MKGKMNQAFIDLKLKAIPDAGPMDEKQFNAIGRGLYIELAKMGEHERLAKGFIPEWAMEGLKSGIERFFIAAAVMAEIKATPGDGDKHSEFALDEKELQAKVEKHVTEACKALLRAAAQAEAMRRETV